MAEPAITTPHNQTVGSEELSTVFLNYYWRRLIAEQVAPMAFRSFWSGSEADVDSAVNNALDLIRDLYDAETSSVNKTWRLRSQPDYVIALSTWEPLQIEGPVAAPHSWFVVDAQFNMLNGTITFETGSDGFYDIRMTSTIGLYNAGAHRCRIILNGTDYIAIGQARANPWSTAHAHCLVYLEDGDVLTFQHWGSSSGEVKKTVAGTDSTYIEGVRVFP